MILEFNSNTLFDEFDTCSGMATEELLADFSDIMLSAPDSMEIVQFMDEHGMAVLVLLALRQYNSNSTPES